MYNGKNVSACLLINLFDPEMEKVGDTGDISLLFFLAGANFWAILGHF